ncbi:zinc-binding metallopeptidase family protein [Bremerella cremea]|uniref:zinc-binding metallopeptidase family protein n=1 Tax=Bremerella cremea TaxID=1031537 RepID=UPI0031F0272A
MRTFRCQCGRKLFFGSTRCVACDATVAMCPCCRNVAAMAPQKDGSWKCTAAGCGHVLKMCQNRVDHEVCNRGVEIEEEDQPRCTYCRLNRVIPDLKVPGNLEKWRRLETAKRRVLDGIELIGLPIGTPSQNELLPLWFEFKADDVQPVSTGHANGVITINVKEADSVHREQTRVEFGEPQRTLVGHFRHELGHYYWDLIVKPKLLSEFRDLFGNEEDPTYAEAQQAYYKDGPQPDWQQQFISGYATMHPWEDFAESFAAYLDMTAIVITAQSFPRIEAEVPADDFDKWLQTYREIGVMANEFNRDIGLLDLVPEVFTQPVVEKLRFMASLGHPSKLARPAHVR